MTLRLSAVVSSVLFTVGYVVMATNGNGANDAQSTIDFYNSDGRMLVAYLMGIALSAGALALVWFFNEVRSRLADDSLSRVGFTAGVIGASAAAIGAAILIAPVGSQLLTDDPFVGVPVVDTFAQAGLGVTVFLGMTSLALATALFSLGAKRAGLLPSWAAWAGVVVAVVMLGSFIILPGFVFPVWVLAFGLFLRSERQTA